MLAFGWHGGAGGGATAIAGGRSTDGAVTVSASATGGAGGSADRLDNSNRLGRFGRAANAQSGSSGGNVSVSSSAVDGTWPGFGTWWSHGGAAGAAEPGDGHFTAGKHRSLRDRRLGWRQVATPLLRSTGGDADASTTIGSGSAEVTHFFRRKWRRWWLEVGGAGGTGGSGGAASATASTTTGSGSAEADAQSSGGNGGRGGFADHGGITSGGNGGSADANSAATLGGSGNTRSFATAKGGAGGDSIEEAGIAAGGGGDAEATSSAISRGSGDAAVFCGRGSRLRRDRWCF